MICRQIALCDFRNIEKACVSFAPGVNLLYGNNAQGKTNLLEALYYAAIGKSFRGQTATGIIRFSAEAASLCLDYTAGGREQNISVRLFQNKMRAVEQNHIRVGRMSEIVGKFRAVLFCPEHLSLIKDGPAERRQFLDIAISAMEPVYLSGLQRYARILKQRNALIHAAKGDADTFRKTVDVWSEQLASEAAYIARSRHRYIQKIEKRMALYFAEMTGQKEIPSLVYHGCLKAEADYEDIPKTKEVLLRQLCSNHEREIGAGTTLFGTHKDDMEVLLNGHAARGFCSQGQQRSLAIALKLSEGDISKEDCGEYPVFLFDDVLSELDAMRRSFLLNRISGKQVIMTACEKDLLPSGKRIFVENGTFREER